MRRNRNRVGQLATLVMAIGLTGGVAGCTAQYRNHGYMPDAQAMAEISVGKDTRESVTEKIGTPTTSGVLDDSAYYYVRQRVKSYAFMAPETVSREVMAVSFTPGGTVSNIERYGLEDGKVIELNRRVTDSSTADKTLIRQLLGSLGNFDAASILGAE